MRQNYASKSIKLLRNNKFLFIFFLIYSLEHTHICDSKYIFIYSACPQNGPNFSTNRY